MRFQGDVDFARLLAKATFRARNPFKAADAFIREYNSVGKVLASNNVEPRMVRTLTSLSRVRGSLLKTTHRGLLPQRDVRLTGRG